MFFALQAPVDAARFVDGFGKLFACLAAQHAPLPVDAKGKTFTTLGIPDHAVALSVSGTLRCTLCRVISGMEQDILLLRPEHCGEGAPALRVAAARENSLRAGETVCVALDAEKLLLL